MIQYTESNKLTRSIRDSETSIDFVQGPPSSWRERVKKDLLILIHNSSILAALLQIHKFSVLINDKNKEINNFTVSKYNVHA